MPRPCKCRWVDELPAVRHYRPAGGCAASSETVVLGLDELESVRLADLEGLYQGDAAERMNVSRPTFGRILQRGRAKLADAVLHGKPLIVEGGPVCAFSPGGIVGRGRGCGSARRSCRRFQSSLSESKQQEPSGVKDRS